MKVKQMPTKKKKKLHEQKRIQETTEKNKKERGSVRAIADCLIISILDGYITYRQFKEIQAIVDAKFDKPCWVIRKQIKND